MKKITRLKNFLCEQIKKIASNLKNNQWLYPLVALMLSFCLVITSSVAWFTLNRKTDATDMEMGLAVDDTSAIYQAYMYDLETELGTDQASDGSDLNIANLTLNPYDTIFRAKNKYTPAFAKITIKRNQSMPDTGTVHVSVFRMDDSELSGESEAYTSNIIRFTAFVLSDDTDITDANALYEHVSTDTRFKTVEDYEGNGRADSKTFVTASGEGADHVHEIADFVTVSVHYSDSDWYIADDGSRALNVYLYITYDVSLINCYKNTHSDNGISLNDTGIEFQNDFKKIRISYDA